MLRLEEIIDVKTLQQVASHLEKTTVRQSKEIAKLSEVDPSAYVTLAAKRAFAEPGAVTLPSDLT